jgi:hypothetical protein
MLSCLTLDTAWHTLALGAGLTTGNVDIPRPSRAGCAKNVDVGCGWRNGTVNVGESKTLDRDTAGWGTSWGAVLVILLNDNTVGGDTREGDVLVGNTADKTSGTRDGLDTDTVGRVLDSGWFDNNVRDSVVRTATDGTDGETVSTRANSSREGDAGTRVDGQAVILVLDIGVDDLDVGRASDVECISVVASSRVSGRVVNVDVLKSKTRCTVDGEDLNWGVHNVETSDGRCALQGVGIEELWLGLSTVGSLSIPVLGSKTVELVAGGTSDDDISSRDGNERAGPLVVLEGGSTLEDDVSTTVESGHIKSSSRWDSDAVESDGSTALLGLGSIHSIGEVARSSSLDSGILNIRSGSRSRSRDSRGESSTAEENANGGSELNHFGWLLKNVKNVKNWRQLKEW